MAVYNVFQGDNEFVITGKFKDWHFRDQLKNIKVPTFNYIWWTRNDANRNC